MSKFLGFAVVFLSWLLAVPAYSAEVTALQEATDAIVAQQADDPCVPAVTLKVAARSQYVTGNGYANGSAVQEDMFFSWPCGFYVDLWHSGGSYRKASASFADEIDYSVGFAGTAKLLGSNVGFDLAAGYFDLYELGDGDGDILDPALTLSMSFDLGGAGSLSPMLKMENAITLPQWDSRWILTAGVTHSVAIGWQGASVSNTVKVVHDNGTKTADDGMLLRWRIGIDVPLTDDGTVILGLDYERYWMGSGIRDREDVGTCGVSLTFKF